MVNFQLEVHKNNSMSFLTQEVVIFGCQVLNVYHLAVYSMKDMIPDNHTPINNM